LLREQLRNYPSHTTTGAALYFLGRHLEEHGDTGSAAACYQKLSQTFQNHYYAMLARERLTKTGGATASADSSRFLAGLNLTEAKPVPAQGSRATALHIE